MIGVGIGIPVASLCINRRLYHVASIRVVSVATKPDKHRTITVVDLAIGVGLPVLVMALRTFMYPSSRYLHFPNIQMQTIRLATSRRMRIEVLARHLIQRTVSGRADYIVQVIF